MNGVITTHRLIRNAALLALVSITPQVSQKRSPASPAPAAGRGAAPGDRRRAVAAAAGQGQAEADRQKTQHRVEQQRLLAHRMLLPQISATVSSMPSASPAPISTCLSCSNPRTNHARIVGPVAAVDNPAKQQDLFRMGTNDSAALLPYMAVFVRVVEAGSFSGAARLLGSTPSAVSRRGAAGAGPGAAPAGTHHTPAAAERGRGGVLPLPGHMLDAADAAVAIGERLMRSPRGLVRLSVPKAYGKFVVGPLMPAFLQLPRGRCAAAHQRPEPGPDRGRFRAAGAGYRQPTRRPGRQAARAGAPALLCASPDYLQRHGEPQHPQDLLRHSCLYLGKRRETIAGTCAAASNRKR